MDALFFHDGDPCPCCGEPINLSKSSSIDAVNGLSKEMAKQIQKDRIDLVLLSLDAMSIAIKKAKDISISCVGFTYFLLYTKYASMLMSSGPDKAYIALIDAERKKYFPDQPDYWGRRKAIIGALGIKE